MSRKPSGSKAERSRGRQGHFKGVKSQFLEGHSDAFINGEDRGIFYSRVTQTFIDKFGYELSYKENPPEGTNIESLTPKPLETFPEGERDAEMKRRNEYYTTLRVKLGQWYRHHYQDHPAGRSLLFKAVDGLVSAARLNPPKKKSSREMYYEVAWESKVKPKFDKWWSEQDGKYSEINKFHQRNLFILKELKNEPSSFQEEIKARIKADHQQAMEDWKKKLNTVEMDNTKDEELAIAFAFAKDLLPALADALGNWLNATVIIAAVCPHEGKLEMRVAQSDMSNGLLKKMIAECFKPEWSAFLTMMKRYGEQYFGSDNPRLHRGTPPALDTSGPINLDNGESKDQLTLSNSGNMGQDEATQGVGDVTMIDNNVSMAAQPPIQPPTSPNALFLPPAPSQENLFALLHNPHFGFESGDFGVSHESGTTWDGTDLKLTEQWGGGSAFNDINIDLESFGHNYSTAGHCTPGLASHPTSFDFSSVSGAAVNQQPLQLPIQPVSDGSILQASTSSFSSSTPITATHLYDMMSIPADSHLANPGISAPAVPVATAVSLTTGLSAVCVAPVAGDPSATTSPAAAPATAMVPAEVTKTSRGGKRKPTTGAEAESATTTTTEPAAKKVKKSKKSRQDTSSAAPNGSRRTKRQINPPSRGPQTVVDPDNPPVYGKAGWIFVQEPVGEPLAPKPLNQ
ncbi:hypothetical protein M378DRAFT_16782 [Amanita muscaria Koide BX008]|uniref:Uncharacterized protein n=1 Tax=Amanita muscaria (strain Koide BX008) TaxID=946122 RepID=A0A0C2WKQ2_AMAMK|nr:hypothetical protein M378DRAFT_16782 [Amanita muscaria Koide BX008]